MMWIKRVGLALGVILVLLAAVLFAGEGARRLFITDTGRLDYYPTTEADALRLCKQSGETNCEKRWFDTNGVLQHKPTHGVMVGPLATGSRHCLQGATLQECWFENGGVVDKQITEIVGGARPNTRNDIPAGKTHTIGFAGDDAMVFTEATNTIAIATGINFTVPGWAASIPIMADGLYMQGCTLTTDGAVVSGGLIEPYITCGDNDAHGFHRAIEIPNSWDGGNLWVMIGGVNTNATPGSTFQMHVSVDCKRTGETVGTTIPTTNERPVTINFGTSGVCGASACTQNQRFSQWNATEITPTGTCTGIDRLLRVQAQVDAGATTEVVAGVKITGIKIDFRRSVLKDN